MKNKRRTELILFIFTIFCFGLSVFIIFFHMNPGRFYGPEKLLEKYMQDIEKGDYAKMYTLLDQSSKEMIDKNDFIERNREVYRNMDVSNTWYEIMNITEKDKNIRIKYSAGLGTVAGDINFENEIYFSYDFLHGYGIEWSDKCIFPNLNSSDKVVVKKVEGTRGNIYDRNGILLAGTDENGKRIYPLGKAASHLLGYIQNVTIEDLEKHVDEGYDGKSKIGRVGLESVFEKRLRAKTGYVISIYTFEGECKEELLSEKQVDGEDIYLTIDANLQKLLFEQFQEDKSCSVAMNPLTGEVLALVSTPSYDANDFIRGISEELWRDLNEDERNVFENRFKEKWVPGSVMKPIIASIGITNGKLNPLDDLGNEGHSWQKDESWGKYFITTLTAYKNACLKNALVFSDNIYFAKVALMIGNEILVNSFNKMGFGENNYFDLVMEESQYSNSKSIDNEILLADTGYGQGEVLVNPLHLTAIYSAFLNKGNMIMPYLVLEKDKKPMLWKENVFSAEAVDIVREDLVEVVENPNGTGRSCKIENMKLAAKTGTAEIKDSKEDTLGTELGWLVIFTPENKRNPVCITTMVEDVKNRGGSSYVSKRVRTVLKNYY